jgi:hypothetical protein
MRRHALVDECDKHDDSKESQRRAESVSPLPSVHGAASRLTGHKTDVMFKRYADPFTKDEKRARGRAVQQKRQEWQKTQPHNLVVMRAAGGRQ